MHGAPPPVPIRVRGTYESYHGPDIDRHEAGWIERLIGILVVLLILMVIAIVALLVFR